MTDSQVRGGIHVMSLEHFTAPKTMKCAKQTNFANAALGNEIGTKKPDETVCNNESWNSLSKK